MQSGLYKTTGIFPEMEINTAWENNELIQGIASGQDQWVLLTSNKSRYGLQRWATNPEFPSAAIKEGWDEKYDIIFLAYVLDRWVVIQAMDTGFSDQIWRTSSRFPEKEIKQGIKDGYVVTGLSYGVDRWVVVMSKGSKIAEQTFATYSEFPEDAINEGWNNGMHITSLAYGDQKWALVMSGKTGFTKQSWATRTDFDKEIIKENRTAGNDISELFYANDMWVFVFTTFSDATETESGDSTTEGLTTTPTFKSGVNPDAADSFRTGQEFANKNQHEEAIGYFRNAIKSNPDYYMAYNSLGVSLDATGNKDEALDCFRQAFELNQTDPIVLGNLVCQVIDNQASTGEITDAVEKAGENTVDDIISATTLNNIGYAYTIDHQYETGIDYYNKALGFDPDNAVIKQNLEEAETSLADSRIGIYTLPETLTGPESIIIPAPETVAGLLKELNKLTGLEEIKRDVDALLKFIKVEKKRSERGIAVGSTTLHTVFAGPPGTGKTTMARLMGRLFKAMGLLKKGHVVEVDRSALVGEYIGQTAIKTNKVIDSALDGILFIDEAYSLVPSDARNDFGEEAVNTLVKRMEDHKHNLIVIVAGYEEQMKRFINSNPGLQHRFTRYFYFKDYSPEQLTTIFDTICIEKKFMLNHDAELKVTRYFDFLYRTKNKQFGNARTANNLFEEVVRYQSARLGSLDIDNLSDEELLTVTIEDVTESVKDQFVDKHIETVEEVMAELNTLIGLGEIKENILTLINYIKTQKKLIAQGHEADEISLHSVFFGPPGTGKTTVARLIGRIYKALELLPKGHVVEVSRANLVAEFVGQTAPRTHAVIDSAMYGVLFIDEAYSLAQGSGSNDFGNEAITTLLKRMDDDRDKFAVIVAGYTSEMQNLIQSNSGLESRFNNYFFFNDYTPAELLGIFNSKVMRKKFEITPDALKLVEDFMNKCYTEKSISFGNGRMVRNFYEKLIKAQSNRIAALPNPTREEMTCFVIEDVSYAIKSFTSMTPSSPSVNTRRPVGFR